MSVSLRRQRDGKLRPYWYGEYVDINGKRKIDNLGRWQGTPPPSLLGTGDATTGDEEFEKSRKDAEDLLKAHAKEAGRKGRAEHLTERLIEAKTGRKVEYARIADLATRWRNLGRETAPSEAHLANCDAHFRRFVDFMAKQKPEASYLYEVTPEDAAAFIAKLRTHSDAEKPLAPATAHYCVRLISKALTRFLPVGATNPFAEFVGRRKNNTSGVVHRQPFTQEELQKLLSTARNDKLMYPLIVTAACSGMRRGDVCELKWSAVDLKGGMLTVKTSKTDASVEIPIFGPLRAVLEKRKGIDHNYVFPEAAAMMKKNADGLSYRFKKIVAKALDTGALPPLPPPVPAAEIREEGVAAVESHVPDGERKERILDCFQRYAAGDSFRKIGRETGLSKGTVSYDLECIERWIGKRFVRSTPGRHTQGEQRDIKSAIDRVTRVTRERGQMAASVRDWHALRTTFVTLALTAGVPMELVRRVTGHATVEVVLKHYFRPNREQFRTALTDALPDVLTGGVEARKLTAKEEEAQELKALAEKLASGTLTKEEKKLFRVLAAKV